MLKHQSIFIKTTSKEKSNFKGGAVPLFVSLVTSLTSITVTGEIFADLLVYVPIEIKLMIFVL